MTDNCDWCGQSVSGEPGKCPDSPEKCGHCIWCGYNEQKKTIERQKEKIEQLNAQLELGDGSYAGG